MVMDCNPFFINMIVAHVSESEEDDLLKIIENFADPKEVLTHVQLLKDEGNSLFKKGTVQVARGIYELVAKLLSYVLPTSTGDKDALRDLAFSLNLNIAACALKLNDFDRAMALCSFVLEFDSNNAKALYRRALAAREKGTSNAAYLKLAYHDLLKASRITHANKDIQRELQVVRIAFFASGNRKLECPEGYDRDYKGKQVIVTDENDSSCSDVSSVVEVLMSTTASSRLPDEDEKGHQVLIKSDTMIVECLAPPTAEQLLVSEEEGNEPTVVVEAEGDGVVDPNGNPFPSHILTTDMALEMAPLVSVAEKDNSVITDDASSGVVQPPDTIDTNFVPEVDMTEPFYRFSNSHKKGCYLSLPGDSYTKLNSNKEVTFCHPRSSPFMIVRLIRDVKKFPDAIPSEQARGKMEFTTSMVGPTVQQTRSSQDEGVPSMVESSLTSCLMQESSTMEHESLIKPRDNQPKGEQAIPSIEAPYMEEEVTSAWSNIDIVHLNELYILNKKPMQLRKQSVSCGSLKTSSRATTRRTTHGKRRHYSRRSTCSTPVSTNVPFLCRYHCGSKRKASTYSGEDGIRPFVRRKFFPSTVCSNLMEHTNSLEYHQHLSLPMRASAVGACP